MYLLTSTFYSTDFTFKATMKWKRWKSFFLFFSFFLVFEPLRLLFGVSWLIVLRSHQIKFNSKKSSLFANWQKWKMIFKFFFQTFFVRCRQTGKPGKCWFDLVSCFFSLAFHSKAPKSFHVLLVKTWRWLYEFSLLLLLWPLFLEWKWMVCCYCHETFRLPHRNDKLLFFDGRSGAHCWWVWSQIQA